MLISSTSLTLRRSNPGAITARAMSRPLTPRVTTISSRAWDSKRRWIRHRITTKGISWYRASSEVESPVREDVREARYVNIEVWNILVARPYRIADSRNNSNEYRKRFRKIDKNPAGHSAGRGGDIHCGQKPGCWSPGTHPD